MNWLQIEVVPVNWKSEFPQKFWGNYHFSIAPNDRNITVESFNLCEQTAFLIRYTSAWFACVVEPVKVRYVRLKMGKKWQVESQTQRYFASLGTQLITSPHELPRVPACRQNDESIAIAPTSSTWAKILSFVHDHYGRLKIQIANKDVVGRKIENVL